MIKDLPGVSVTYISVIEHLIGRISSLKHFILELLYWLIIAIVGCIVYISLY